MATNQMFICNGCEESVPLSQGKIVLIANGEAGIYCSNCSQGYIDYKKSQGTIGTIQLDMNSWKSV